MAFDDLANVLRRIREDFGVEVNLDTSPLKADATGRVRQHAVVGTIHYNGPTGDDKGTIVYFKPTLTGDEPADIQNYKSRTQQFPHESTGDQFFDEAQWESYRRLGEHAGWSMLGFTETLFAEEFNFTDRLFMGVRERLHPSAEDYQDTFVEMSQRCAELEASLCNDGPVSLRQELFPEAVDPDPKLPRPAARDDDEVQAISYLTRALQIMEDVWLACDLDRYWSHPLNEGWMNYFQRWASTPTFRRWWPILRPIYSSGFREFAKERFGVGIADPQARPNDRLHGAARLTLERELDQARFEKGHAWRQFIQRSACPDGYVNLARFVYRMHLPDGEGELSSQRLDVGLVLVREYEENKQWIAEIAEKHFFVPPALGGSGIIGRQLDAVVNHYATATDRQFGAIKIVFDGRPGNIPRGEAARLERIRQVEFFKSRAFEQDPVPAGSASTLGSGSYTRLLRPTS